MRVGIDGRMFDKYLTSVGVGRYTYNLVQNLVKVDQENECLLFTNDPEKIGKYVPASSQLEIKKINLPMFSLRSQLKFPSILKKEKLDVFHAPYFDPPRSASIPLVMTIHDLIHLIFPHYFSKKVQLYYQGVVKPAARRSNKIIADSVSSKEDIVRILGISESKVVVIHPGVEEKFRPLVDPQPLEPLRQKYSLSKKVILFVGSMKPHKNLVRLIEAFYNLRQKERIEYQLLVVGEKDQHFPQVRAKVEELELGQEVVFTGLVPDEEMPLFYNAAQVLVLPSLYEGFGLPALEAMACGTPVIASKVSSLPEVVGDAAVLVDPYNTDDIAQAMPRLLKSKASKQKLVGKGLERARLFSWDKTAQQTLQVYREATGGRK